jgi:c-di-AMP phosphodiesterase-like protein
MGNLVSLHKNDFDRIYAFLRFFGKKIILRTSKGYIFYKNDDKTCSLKDFTESIIDNIYKGDKENINDVVSKFYETNSQNSLPILFDIILTNQLIEKSLENFKIIIGEINPDNLDKQIKCP